MTPRERDDQGRALSSRPRERPGDADAAVWACARGLDAVQEAERVGSWLVDVPHLLSAALLDPVARRLFLEAGGDLDAVVTWVGRPLRAGVHGGRAELPRPARMTLSSTAAAVLERLVARTRTDAALARACEVTAWRGPRERSTLRRWMLHDLLSSSTSAVIPESLSLSLDLPHGARERLDAPSALSSYDVRGLLP